MLNSYIKSCCMRLGNRELDLSQPQVMAIVNLTDDSFYEGSRCETPQAVADAVRRAVADGATIIDVGGYSSRPGAKDISMEEEWRRVECGLKAVGRVSAEIAVSVDTFRAEVARRALDSFGDLIINDISAGEADEDMANVVAQYDVPYVAMHMRGVPQTMHALTDYPEGVVAAVCDYFCHRIEWLHSRGVRRLILDPGFGFAKSVEQNYELLAGLHRLCDMGYPVLAGLSRKSMIYKPLGIGPSDALNGTTALHWEALRQGATILRAHDVKEARQVASLFEYYKKGALQ